jgi:hypothetical protein
MADLVSAKSIPPILEYQQQIYHPSISTVDDSSSAVATASFVEALCAEPS